MSRMTLMLAAALLAVAGAGLGYWRGQAAGQAKAQAAHNALALAQVQHALAEHQALIDQSRQASAALRLAVAAQAELDLSTTKDLADALAKTAGQRTGCKLDAGLMRQLAAARDRAGRAAARGLAGAVPAAATDAGR